MKHCSLLLTDIASLRIRLQLIGKNNFKPNFKIVRTKNNDLSD